MITNRYIKTLEVAKTHLEVMLSTYVIQATLYLPNTTILFYLKKHSSSLIALNYTRGTEQTN